MRFMFSDNSQVPIQITTREAQVYVFLFGRDCDEHMAELLCRGAQVNLSIKCLDRLLLVRGTSNLGKDLRVKVETR